MFKEKIEDLNKSLNELSAFIDSMTDPNTNNQEFEDLVEMLQKETAKGFRIPYTIEERLDGKILYYYDTKISFHVGSLGHSENMLELKGDKLFETETERRFGYAKCNSLQTFVRIMRDYQTRNAISNVRH